MFKLHIVCDFRQNMDITYDVVYDVVHTIGKNSPKTYDGVRFDDIVYDIVRRTYDIVRWTYDIVYDIDIRYRIRYIIRYCKLKSKSHTYVTHRIRHRILYRIRYRIRYLHTTLYSPIHIAATRLCSPARPSAQQSYAEDYPAWNSDNERDFLDQQHSPPSHMAHYPGSRNLLARFLSDIQDWNSGIITGIISAKIVSWFGMWRWHWGGASYR